MWFTYMLSHYNFLSFRIEKNTIIVTRTCNFFSTRADQVRRAAVSEIRPDLRRDSALRRQVQVRRRRSRSQEGQEELGDMKHLR